ncbi:MAG TPA: HlyD family efflux transporter periplasmic adaptor subunit [Kofleriaceae bacterium]|nr:HlyD family efflux transporter periplasmic adaptor subunit [Kofleriaceae bacterium]
MRTLIIVLALLAGACHLGQDDTRWVSARRGELVVGVDLTGALASTEAHPLGPPPISDSWNFKIAFMADEGSQVTAGTPVLGFDPTELTQKLEEYRNEADSAVKELAAHRATANMALREGKLAVEQAEAAERKAALKVVGDENLIALNELKRVRLDHEFARYAASVSQRKVSAKSRQDRAEFDRLTRVQKRAEERIEQLGQSIARMQVTAPIDGTVLYIIDWQGNKKKIGDNAWRGERLIEVVSLAQMKANGEVDEMDASRVVMGQAVRLRLDANADVELTGKVVKIEDAVQRRSPEDPLKVVKLEISLDPAEGIELRPGMRFRGSVETERITDVLVVPLDAVFATRDGAMVYRKDGRSAEPTRVTLGRRGNGLVEILSGLEVGDRVAILDAGASSTGAAKKGPE